jgi:Tol biopolymer transport system component
MGSNITSDWSPDGRYLAYVSIRGYVPTDRFSRTLSIRDFQTGNERDLWPPLAFFLSPRWSPDGRTILVMGLDLENRSGIHQIDVDTGRASPVIVGQAVGEYEWSPDSRSILYRKGAGTIVSRELATGIDTIGLDLPSLGAERLVARPGPPVPLMLRTFELSPDGQRLAVTIWSGNGEQTRASLAVHDRGTALRNIHTAKRLGFHGWTPDGNALFFTTPTEGSPSHPSSALWWIASNGGAPHATGLELPGLSTVRISPDATRLTFTAGFDGGEVRVAEGLLDRAGVVGR